MTSCSVYSQVQRAWLALSSNRFSIRTLLFLPLLQDRLDASCVYPHLRDIREVSLKVAVAIAANKYATGQASVLPQPADLEAHIRSVMYEPSY